MKAILHTHSIYSDGAHTPEEVAKMAHDASVELLSLTDHNNFEGYERFEIECKKLSVPFVKGIELDCSQPEIGFNRELLAYFPHGGEECLEQIIAYKQEARTKRAENAIECCIKELRISDLSIDELKQRVLESRGFIGMLTHRILYEYLVFKGAKLPKYTEAKQLPFWKGMWKREDNNYSLYELIPIINNAGGFAVFPHFGYHCNNGDHIHMQQNRDIYIEQLKYMKSIGLWGIEMHPYHFAPNLEQINSIIAQWAEIVGLHITSGSDFHGGPSSEHAIFEWYGADFKGFIR